jgi:hypothetical protein
MAAEFHQVVSSLHGGKVCWLLSIQIRRSITAFEVLGIHKGLALLSASTYGAGMAGLKLAVLAYLLVTVLLLILFLRWRRGQLQQA